MRSIFDCQNYVELPLAYTEVMPRGVRETPRTWYQVCYSLDDMLPKTLLLLGRLAVPIRPLDELVAGGDPTGDAAGQDQALHL